MAKIEVTDEMVERARKFIFPWSALAQAPELNFVRRALEAALNPTADPEIPVTNTMLKAGIDELNRALPRGNLKMLEAAYRAMEKKRREEAAEFISPVSWHHSRKGDGCLNPNTPPPRHHHRKSDGL